MKNLALARIQNMKPYKPPLAGRSSYNGMLLDFNERTIVPQNTVVRALEKFVKSKKIQVYPEYFDLEKKIAAYAGINDDQVMITNGSDQGIDIIFRTFTEKGDKVIIPSPSFAMFFQCAQIVGNKIVSPLYKKDDLAFPLNEVLDAIDKQTKLIIVCNPNNPTGTLLPVASIEKIAQKAKESILLIDEAYFEFSKITAVPLIKKYPNIIITRTFSKAFGLAALRIGYVIAKFEYIVEMLKVRGPYDINMSAYYAAYATLENKKSMERYVEDVMKKAKPLAERFFSENDVPYFASRANFILFKPKKPERTMRLLSKNGVLVRPQNKKRVENTLRVAIGTTQQMKKFIEIYKKTILKNAKKRCAFLDRDGTLIFEPQDTYQIDSLEKLKVLDGVIEGLQELKKRDYSLIMISNQDGLGTPSFPKENFKRPHERMLKIFRDNGIVFEKIFICPHLPEDKCNCRKPKTGLVDEFLRSVNMDKNLSFVCGDRDSDREFAKNIGVKFVPMKTNGNFYKAIKSFFTKLI